MRGGSEDGGASRFQIGDSSSNLLVSQKDDSEERIPGALQPAEVTDSVRAELRTVEL